MSILNSIFDPLGLLSPAMIYPKLILQSSWSQKIGWNDELPKDLSSCFLKWVKQIKWLADVQIPRHMKSKEFCKKFSKEQLHIFSDASQVAYATTVFLRIQHKDTVSVQLIQAKARVAPIQKMTIPRLELMVCVIGARLGSVIHNTLSVKILCFYWTDSTTALSWINRNDEWGTFVGNRVREILTLSSTNDWRYIPGKSNPADLPSRGCSPKELLESKWWEGPNWLKSSEDQWPVQDFEIDEDIINSEKRKSVKNNNVNINVPVIIEDPWFAKNSSYLLCLRGLAWVKRFVNNCLAKKRNINRHTGPLTMKELDESEITMIKLVQLQVFPRNSHYISGLHVSFDKDQNVYYVVTKLLNREDTGRFKKPLLLPNKHPVVQKLIWEEHLKYAHAGPQFLINRLREKFWIIKTRQAVTEIWKSCITCKRYHAKAPSVPVAPLNRIKNAKVFEISGIDLAGPLWLRDNTKVWVVIFTCAVLRAVHLESVEKINSEEFVLALSRFIYRRGRPSVIYTDNGTNFVGTVNLLGRLDWNKIQNETQQYRIQWIFIPPASPWWVGFWERLVRSMKEYLRKLLGHNKLTKVELDTALNFVESLLNDRPLTYITEDQNDLIPLSPAAFLRDLDNSEFPEIEVLNDKKLRMKHTHLIQLKKELRERFRKEYLGLLIQRKTPTNDYHFEVGEIVLVSNDNQKRFEWPKARIIELMPGLDNIVRVARIKTSDGEMVRSLQRLIPLEIKSMEREDVSSEVLEQARILTNSVFVVEENFENN